LNSESGGSRQASFSRHDDRSACGNR
jgi:hypothetical protein